jgi:hypothetical protein
MISVNEKSKATSVWGLKLLAYAALRLVEIRDTSVTRVTNNF